MRHDETVLGAIFNADASKVLSFGWDNAAYLWDAEPPAWPGEIIPVPGEVRSIEFDGNDDRIFVATRNGRAGLWSLSKKKFVTPIADHGSAISAAAFQPFTKQFATAGTDGVGRFLECKNEAKSAKRKQEGFRRRARLLCRWQFIRRLSRRIGLQWEGGRTRSNR
jgi:WD40 repeat protein